MKIKEIFDNIYKVNNKLATKNLIKGHPVYGERIFKHKGEEYRSWTPYRSKLGAAIASKLEDMPIKTNTKILYLGASTGTTASHVSDIIGEKGEVYCVEFAGESMQKLLQVCENRKNMIPVYANAHKPEEYLNYADIENVDVIFEDVAQPDQAQILIKNAKKYLKEDGYVMIAIKSQSIDVSKKPEEVFEMVINKLKTYFKLVERIDISKFEKNHLFLVLKKK